MNKIYKKKDKLIIEVGLKQERYCPFKQEYYGEMNNIVGMVREVLNCNVPDIGFCYNIDMAYKDKGDQNTDFFYLYYGEQEDFEKLCNELGIDIVYEQE